MAERGWSRSSPCLLAVDDATSAVVNAVFRPEEDTRGYFILMQGLIERWGLPLALYGDRHGVFKFSGKPRHIQPPVEATHFSRALVELGIQQIFARSPQAKGRVERAAGTFQDRLVTELRLASASTIDQANAVLRDFLPRYNTRFTVPADLPEPAYRPWDGNRPSDEILCLKHGRKVARDNTVKYRCRTLQLLPSRERPSYAGVQVEVLEHTDDRLQVRHEGEIIPCRPAPPRPGALRASHGALAPNPEIGRIVKRLGNHRVSQPQLRHLANLEPDPVVEEPAVDNHHSEPPSRREFTPRQLALWKAVQQARAQGLSLPRNLTSTASTPQYCPEVRPLPHPADQSPHQPWGQRIISTSHQPLRLTESLDNNTLGSLPPREGEVIEMRFGLTDGRTRTLQEIGEHFGLTRERIRQLEAKALKKLRQLSRSRKLREFLE